MSVLRIMFIIFHGGDDNGCNIAQITKYVDVAGVINFRQLSFIKILIFYRDFYQNVYLIVFENQYTFYY